ncbi:MAG: hypothetical protein DRI23_02255 [Candidatus Cloacimonadota bacterium]|nr:MAG: hypothetical protein DRI23_02255 [Candidatus Cloacimonadota bacterium]RLC54463.1 MAG: hypothetical protein DRH79_00435 [Candidatus Cloacimonadota bacterium]
MQIKDLVAIGKLGNCLHKNGFISFKEAENFELFFLKNIFLLFTDNRVRYVEVIDLETDNGIKIRIDDDEIAMDVVEDGNVQVMLAKEDIKQLQQENDVIDLVGIPVVFEGNEIGFVTESFFNGAHEVISFENENGKEIMIPLVEAYVIGIDENGLNLKGIEGFLEL